MPQENVTIRYASNLLRDGVNDAYELEGILQQTNLVEGVAIGFFYRATVKCGPAGDFASHNGVGATPLQAVRRALERHGVTFR